MKGYIGGLIMLLLTWTTDPVMGQVVEHVHEELGTESGMEQYIDMFRQLLSTITTVVILITAFYKMKKERSKQKDE